MPKLLLASKSFEIHVFFLSESYHLGYIQSFEFAFVTKNLVVRYILKKCDLAIPRKLTILCFSCHSDDSIQTTRVWNIEHSDPKIAINFKF